jgi:hypothetical protein
VRQKLLTPNIISQQSWTKKEIAKKNCLTLIIKNVNVTYSQSEVTAALKKMMDESNIIYTYFPRGNAAKDQHDGICNLEVINPIIYKQYVRKNPKLLHMYTKFTPHPRSLDRTNIPTTELLREFGFSEVNTAITNALNAINNSGTGTTSAPKPPTPNVTLE